MTHQQTAARHTADTITDDALDQLYAELAEHKRAVEYFDAQSKRRKAALDRVRRLCHLTINASVRVDAVHQAQDTLATINGPKEN